MPRRCSQSFLAFGFFGAIIFLPRWFQVVQGSRPPTPALIAPTHGRPDPQLGPVRADRVQDWSIQVADRRSHLAHGRRGPVDDSAHQGHADNHDVGMDAHRRPRRGHVVRSADDRHPECGAVQEAWCGNVEPDVLPPDRRHDRPRLRRDDFWVGIRGSTRPAVVGERRPPAADRRYAAGRWRLRHRSADQRRGPRGEPCGGHPGSVPVVHSEHYRRHPRGIQPRDRPDVLARSHWSIIAAIAAVAIKEIPLRSSNSVSVPAAEKERAVPATPAISAE